MQKELPFKKTKKAILLFFFEKQNQVFLFLRSFFRISLDREKPLTIEPINKINEENKLVDPDP